jgi:dienelactone hydrolase
MSRKPSAKWSVPIAACCLVAILAPAMLMAQSTDAETKAKIQAGLSQLQDSIARLRSSTADARRVADVEIYAKAAEGILRHDEFYKPSYAGHTLAALETGHRRAAELASGRSSWLNMAGTQIHGYVSRVDGSVQPYALTLPAQFDRKSPERWPLHVVLHGRGNTLNEVSFIAQHDGKAAPGGQTWIQLDVFGRTNNAYRWAGETDVFEAIDDVKRDIPIDEQRITLRGFSMGGAGAWHLGLHYPSMWSSVGPGAGFVDFYKYQKHAQSLPAWQHKTLHIYDSIDYVTNAFNVPICTYGGEHDKQLVASTSMVEAAAKHKLPIKLLIGKGMGHKFHPDSFREFMAFHQTYSDRGRPAPPDRREIRFITYTPKYNQCEWLTIEELHDIYEPAEVEGRIEANRRIVLSVAHNVAVVQVARDVADQIEIEGQSFSLPSTANPSADGLYFQHRKKGWSILDGAQSAAFRENHDLHKRHNLQGPIDDAFMEPFVCVKGTGKPWTPQQVEWSDWTLARFEREFDKRMRGRVPVVTDDKLTDESIADKNLALFGDPGSNAVLAKILGKLPVRWTRESLEVNGKRYDPATHGVALIYPNPLNRRRYVVINSGHTFHEKDFRSSNAWLFPRLGDIAVQKFEKQPDGNFAESTVWADVFDSRWRLAK